ncbi:MAG: carbohydrate kinase [Alphaproteobacteria bacterium]|nr:carbohydrate kinase [Alphaproteobacteria bacterium]
MYDIISFGEVLWDMLPDGKKLGGAPFNLVYHAIKSGCTGALVSAVGNDALGQEILEIIQQKNVPHFITKNDYPTGTVQIKLENGIPTYTITPNVAWDYIKLSNEMKNSLSGVKVVCYGSLSVRSKTSYNSLKKLISLCSDDVIKFFDVNLRFPFYTKSLTEELLQSCDILKINDEELEFLKTELYTGTSDFCSWLMRTFKIKTIILTGGSSYSKILMPHEILYMPTPKVKVVDTVGAGDAFSGAFLASLIQGKSVAEAHQQAVKISAFVVGQSGACPEY